MSVGYFHADEHYQIIEFAGILDGTNEAKDLTFEYHEQIRSAIQPVIAYLVFQACDLFSITDPFSKALVLRVLTALLSLCVIFFFTGSCRIIVPSKYWRLFLILSYFLWFLPFLNVRFSSETWSGIFLLLSAYIIIRELRNYPSYAILGGTLGLSFLFRYQIAFAVIGIFFWLLIIRKERRLKIGMALFTFLIVFLAGICIDSWYYGEWVITLKNYLFVNLIEGKAASFGTSPWYYYFYFILRHAFFPIGVAILLSFLLVSFKKYKSVFIWIIVPFFIGHTLISHKELRFLFPLVNFIPVLMILAMDSLSLNKWNSLSKKTSQVILVALFTINIIFLGIVCIKPAGYGRVMVMEKIQQLNDREGLNIIHSSNCNPYSPWGLTTNFYKESNAEFYDIDSYELTQEHLDDLDTRIVLVYSLSDQENPRIQELKESYDLKEMGNSLPERLLPFFNIYGYRTKEILLVYSN